MAKKGRTFIFHWRGGYLTRDVLDQLLELIRKAGEERGKVSKVSLNWPQAVLRFYYEEQQETEENEADVTLDAANEGEEISDVQQETVSVEGK